MGLAFLGSTAVPACRARIQHPRFRKSKIQTNMIAHTAYRISSTRILLFRILCILDVSCCAPCPRAFSATRARRSTATGAASVRTRSTASSLAPDTRRATHMGTSAPVTRGTPNMSISADCSTVSGCAATAALRCSGTGVTSDGATMMPPDGAGDASAGCRGTVCRPVSGSKATAESNAIQTVSQDRIAREVRRAGRITYVACVCHAAFAAPERRRRQTQLAAASAPAPLLPRAGFRRPRWCGSLGLPGRIALEFPVTHLADAYVPVYAAQRQLERAEVLDVAHRGGGHGDLRVAKMRQALPSLSRKPRIQR